jgi:hypothetical protein
MKKIMNKTSPRKLVLHREHVVSLTPPELAHVIGGDAERGCSDWRPRSCNPPETL